jgi:hypothetical protein
VTSGGVDAGTELAADASEFEVFMREKRDCSSEKVLVALAAAGWGELVL